MKTVNDTVAILSKKENKSEKVFEYWLQGMKPKEIAKIVYGSERYSNRVRALLHKTKRQFLAPVEDIVHEMEEVNKAFSSGSRVIEYKRKSSVFGRQLKEHEELIFYVAHKLTGKKLSELFTLVRSYHYMVFPRVWGGYGSQLRCWRNGRGKKLFSVTPASLAYTHALFTGVLLLLGMGNMLGKLTDIITELGRPTKKYIDAYRVAYSVLGGKVIGMVIASQLVF